MTQPPPPPPHPDSGQQYTPPAGSYHEPPKSKGWSGLLIGCLVAFGLAFLMCAGVGFYLYSQASTLIIQAARTATESMLRESDLPAEEQSAILEQFDRVATAYKEGDLTLEETVELLQDLAESPLMSVIVFQAMEFKYLNSSGLSPEEIEDAKRTLARLVRAAQEEKLDKSEIEQLSSHILLNPDPSQPNNKQLKNSMTDEELRAFFAEAKQLMDEKEIPDEDTPMEKKVSDVLREIIDRKLAE